MPDQVGLLGGEAAQEMAAEMGVGSMTLGMDGGVC
jgi:hypothetical protein